MMLRRGQLRVEVHPPQVTSVQLNFIRNCYMFFRLSLEFGLSPSKSRLSERLFLQVFVSLREFNNTRSPGIVFVFVFVLALSCERTSRQKWLQHCEQFLYLLLGSDKMFLFASLPSLLYADNILFQLCLFLKDGSGVGCPTLIHSKYNINYQKESVALHFD